jgi:cation:H+ antiporter
MASSSTIRRVVTRHGDYRPVVAEILGGNAFLPVLLVPATLLWRHAVLAAWQRTYIRLTAMRIALAFI